MRYLALVVLLFSLSLLSAQKRDINTFDPDEILVAGDQIPKVLLVGTFHMDYPNLDAHVTAEEDQVNVNEGKRRAEMRELLDYIARFKPTKIVVERWAGANTNDRYEAYLKGDFELGKSEIYQIGFRLAKRFKHKELVLGDAGTLVRSFMYHADSTTLRPIMDSIYTDWDFSGDSKLDKRYDELYDLEDEMLAESTLLEFFKYENSTHRIRRGHGGYLIGDFELDDHRGADALAMHWYARNLRIYRNIQRAVTSPNDRIMVLFGAGHLGILRQQFESSPEFELVDFGSLE